MGPEERRALDDLQGLRRIHRYALQKIVTRQHVTLAPSAKVLSFGAKDGQLNVWVSECLFDDVRVDRVFCLAWTGQPEPLGSQFIGTAITREGDETIVWHCYTWEV